MKANAIPKSAPRLLQAAIAIVFASGPVSVLAALTDLSPAPIASTSSGVVKPNINFVLDSSGSMDREYAPDEAAPFDDRYGFKSSQCNSIYYNPLVNYALPKKHDGTDYAAASFTSAYEDGYDLSSGTPRNLSTSFRAHSGDTSQPAYYYNYSGSQSFNYTNSSSTFYRECNSSIPSGTPGTAVFTKKVVSATSGPGSTDERQNFANWYQYYRTRMLLMKSGAGRAFSTIGANYRIGFMTIYTTPNNSGTDPGYLPIADYDATQKEAWYTKFYAQQPSGATPLKFAVSMAGRNFAGRVGPDPVQYSCQQNFTILTTDGYWNSGTPAGVKLNGTSNITQEDNVIGSMPRPMYDGNVAGASGTLADVAAYYYNTDLRTGTAGACATGALGADVCTNNVPTSTLDTAPHQHMTLFTVGLGVNGQLGFASNYQAGGSADYNAITGGSKNWPNPQGDTLTTIDDLWHAAVNGRGQYFSAKNPDSLVTGLRAALAGVSTREAAGAAAATSNLEPVAGDNYAYVANYRTQKWDGDVESRLIDLSSGAISSTATWSAQAGLDGRTTANGDSRTIFTYLAGAKKDFDVSNFSAAQLDSWFTPGNVPALTQFAGWSAAQKAQGTPASIIAYLRGRYGNEGRPANTFQLYRTRDHVLGDIVNGKPVFVKVPPFQYNDTGYGDFRGGLNGRTGMVYAAANDGMLHAFEAAAGAEQWAFIPSFVLPRLKALADDNYPNAHQFSTDGSPVVADICIANPCPGATSWRTILVAGLNAGGKGYYALDITTPSAPQVLWEFTHAEMGFTYGLPIIAKLKDGSWNVFVTNGYNNADGQGRLFVLNAYTGALKFTLQTSSTGDAATPSGLAKISAWVDNGLVDNTVERIYGGDTLGNLWRFDVNDTIDPPGKEASLFALLQTSGGYRQPITTKPELGEVTGYFTPINRYPVVYIGTGKYLGASDVLDLGQQSVYAIRDDLTATGVGDIRNGPVSPCSLPGNNFVQQSLVVSGTGTFTVTNTLVDFEKNCGWYIDFSAAPNPAGERVNVDPKLQLGVLAVATNIPETSICTVGGTSWLYFFDYRGFAGEFDNPPAVVGQKIGSAIAVGINTYKLPDGRVVSTVTTSDDKHPVFANPDLGLIGTTTKRILWRELLN